MLVFGHAGSLAVRRGVGLLGDVVWVLRRWLRGLAMYGVPNSRSLKSKWATDRVAAFGPKAVGPLFAKAAGQLSAPIAAIKSGEDTLESCRSKVSSD